MRKMNRKNFLKHVSVGTATLLGGSVMLRVTSNVANDQSDRVSPAIQAARLASELSARMIVQPTRHRRTRIESLILSLITSGIWNKLDGFYVFAAHDIQAARLNWVGCMSDVTSVNAPIFQIDRGFTGDGMMAYLDTDTVATTLENFKPDDATIGMYSHGEATFGASLVIGLAGTYLHTSKGTERVSLRANYSSGSPIVIDNSNHHSGLFAWSRDVSNGYVYRAGSALLSATIPPASVSSGSITFLKAGANYSTSPISAAMLGARLSGAQHAALNAALTAYLTSLGD